MFSAFVAFQSILRDQPFADSRFAAQVRGVLSLPDFVFARIWFCVASLSTEFSVCRMIFDGNTPEHCVQA
jgi:hypothetical protein